MPDEEKELNQKLGGLFNALKELYNVEADSYTDILSAAWNSAWKTVGRSRRNEEP